MSDNLPDGTTVKDIDDAGEPQVWGWCARCDTPIYHQESYWDLRDLGAEAPLCDYCTDTILEGMKTDHCHTAED